MLGGVWTRAPQIPRPGHHTLQLAGAWLAKWRALGDEFFSTYTCGWVKGVVEMPLGPNPRREAETFFQWFLDELKLCCTDRVIFETIEGSSSVYIQKTMEILRELRSARVEVDRADLFKAHWFIHLQHHPNARVTVDLAYRMIGAGRRDLAAMVEELWTLTAKREHPYWPDFNRWVLTLKRRGCQNMGRALQTWMD